jgi:hypothetical protein
MSKKLSSIQFSYHIRSGYVLLKELSAFLPLLLPFPDAVSIAVSGCRLANIATFPLWCPEGGKIAA